jgi:GTP cyclohydrolase I
MLQSTKCDPVLGLKVLQHLKSLHLESAVDEAMLNVPDDEKIEKIQQNVLEMLTTIGLDMTNPSHVDTPRRVAKMLVKETMWGLKPENFPKCTGFPNDHHYDEIVIEHNIPVKSSCSHHIVPIVGTCTIAYKPKNIALGLSKLPRIVEYFSRRPTLQELQTQQIGETVKFICETDDVAVVMECEHFCVSWRGVESTGATTSTSFLSGAFRDNPSARQEFLSLARQK